MKDKFRELAELTGNQFLAALASETGKPAPAPRSLEAKAFEMEIPGSERARACRQIHSVSHLFESPIEEIAAYQIMGQKFGEHYANMADKLTGEHVVTIVPQVSYPPHRLDFCIYLRGSFKVALECDGADFHDEYQDAIRDEHLKRVHGIDTVRVTGKNIYRGSIWAESLAYSVGERIIT